MPVVPSFGGASLLNLGIHCKTSIRQGGIEPVIMPTKYSALDQVAKATLSPIEDHLVEDQNGESRCSTYMLHPFLNGDFL